MPKDLKIRTDQRKNVVPIGDLIKGSRRETIPKVEERFRTYQMKGKKFEFYIVGDIVTEDILKNKFLRNFIKICIIDEKTQREQVNIEIKEFFKKILKLKNPKGKIAEQSWEVIKKAIELNERILIHVTEGEEDMLVIPLIITLPLKKGITYFVLYGQPPITDSQYPIEQGIVIVEVNKRVKKLVNNFINSMEKR
ncbi:MAG: DUF359 domain-containing protein [Candidatus Lokiarchaeota archaeon]